MEAVWQSMLEAELNKKYWRRVAEGYSKWDRASKIFLAITSSGTVAAWVVGLQTVAMPVDPAIVWKFLSGLSAMLAIALPILNWQQRIKDAGSLYSGWNARHLAYQIFYSQVGKISDEEIADEYEQSKKEERALDDAIGSFSIDEKLRDRIRQDIITRIEQGRNALAQSM
jgi:hypothetical protein